jgi:flagellar protein FliS
MAALHPNTYYQTQQITTVGRGQLLVLVYDGLLRFCGEGKRAMAEGNLELQNQAITKAQALIIELLSSLDHNAFPELTSRLDSIYHYVYDRLTHANVHDDSAALDEVTRLLKNLREAWAEAELRTRQETVQPAGNHVV